MILLLNESLLLSFLIQKTLHILLLFKKKLMKNNNKDFEISIKIALDNAKKRLDILENSDKQSVLDEYKEWIKDGLSDHTVLLLREDPII